MRSHQAPNSDAVAVARSLLDRQGEKFASRLTA
jgi:hypothetical protein